MLGWLRLFLPILMDLEEDERSVIGNRVVEWRCGDVGDEVQPYSGRTMGRGRGRGWGSLSLNLRSTSKNAVSQRGRTKPATDLRYVKLGLA